MPITTDQLLGQEWEEASYEDPVAERLRTARATVQARERELGVLSRKLSDAIRKRLFHKLCHCDNDPNCLVCNEASRSSYIIVSEVLGIYEHVDNANDQVAHII